MQELYEEQKRLKLQAEVSKQLFFESFANTRRSTTDFVLKGILVPAGAAGLAAWGAKKIFGNGDTGQHEISPDSHHEKNGSNGTLSSLTSKLLPVGLSLLNAYLTKQFVKEEIH